MKKLATRLTDYILKKGTIKKENYDIYKYGFQSGLETIFCVVISILLAIKLEMLLECIIFGAIFILLRSYAGGLHLNSFWACFICSCSVQIGVLLFAKNYQFTNLISFLIILCSISAITIIKPVDHANRPVDEEEKNLFQKYLRIIIIGIFMTSLVLYLLQIQYYLSLIAVTMIIVVLSMIIGKWKQKVSKTFIQKP